jgi:hypothetical protein
MKDVVAIHPHVASEGIADGVIANVAHVQGAGGVGKHLQDVKLGLGGMSLGGVEGGIALPTLDPLLLDALSVVALVCTIGARGRNRFVFLWHRERYS